MRVSSFKPSKNLQQPLQKEKQLSQGSRNSFGKRGGINVNHCFENSQNKTKDPDEEDFQELDEAIDKFQDQIYTYKWSLISEFSNSKSSRELDSYQKMVDIITDSLKITYKKVVEVISSAPEMFKDILIQKVEQFSGHAHDSVRRIKSIFRGLKENCTFFFLFYLN